MECLDEVVVATDSAEILEVCEAAGARAVLTDAAHPSGTDRVAEVAARKEFDSADIVVNLQGDEPLMEAAHVEAAVREVRTGRQVGTCATPVLDAADFLDPGTVKVVRRSDGTALYFSRAPIPFRRDGAMDDAFLSERPALRHLGVYAYGREALFEWVGLPPSPLELTERLEQLRALEAGMSIGVAVVDGAEGGVDTEADARRIEHRMRELGLGS
jgi:3-deoxy-manno-octulosonate cytidylyltransferase (CMP-KDO synthetase)